MKRLDTSGDQRRLLRLLLVLPALMWAAPVLSACGAPSVSEPSDADVAVVFCLSPTERPRLVAAATALGLARPSMADDRISVGGEDTSMEAWRSTSRADFDRSCAALRTASQPGQTAVNRTGGTTSVLNVLLTVIVGGLLTWLAGERRDATARNRSSADALQSSARAFLHASDDFVRDWTGTTGTARPSDHQLNETRRDLAAQLRHVQTLRPRWTEPRRLEEALFTHLGEDLARHWLSQDQAARQDRAEQISIQVRELDANVDRVAHSIERSFLPNRAMFGRVRSSPSGHKDVETTS